MNKSIAKVLILKKKIHLIDFQEKPCESYVKRGSKESFFDRYCSLQALSTVWSCFCLAPIVYSAILIKCEPCITQGRQKGPINLH